MVCRQNIQFRFSVKQSGKVTLQVSKFGICEKQKNFFLLRTVAWVYDLAILKVPSLESITNLKLSVTPKSL